MLPGVSIDQAWFGCPSCQNSYRVTHLNFFETTRRQDAISTSERFESTFGLRVFMRFTWPL